jgi:starch synthase
MEKTKVLFVTQSIDPFMEGHSFAALVRKLSQGTQERDREIRVFMPRFGVINERRHQLHEVIRLSGMNLIINDSDHPLIIKVASIPQARMQVYFIDNDEFFKRKNIFHDKNEKFHDDNAQRALFFTRGVLETVKKLGWSPDIVHCHGWMTAFMPLYLRKMYAQDPHFSGAKVVYTAYDTEFNETIPEDVMTKLNYDEVSEKEAIEIKEPSVLNMHKLAIRYSDGIVLGDETLNKELSSYITKSEKTVLEYHNEDTIIDAHQEFYSAVLELETVLVD